ncbi:MAG: histidine phosphatase family protein [Geminicoccaceae bacterium]
MPELLLLRHAKSSWDQLGVDDHDRDLAPRGERSAKAMGRLLASKRLMPDLVLCSTAKRTMRTLDLLSEELGQEPPVRYLKSLYLAAPSRLLDVVQRQSDRVQRLMLVGHNPGTQELALRLAGSGDPELVRLMTEKFPTGALARLRFPGEAWTSVLPAAGELAGFWRPRDLE